MASVAQKLITAEEFFDWVHLPENRDKFCELERGEIVEMTRPGKRHGFVCANITRILQNYCFSKKKGYVCSNDTGVIVERDPDTVRGPDVLLFEDVQSYQELDRKWSTTAPKVAVEVLSPTDSWTKIMIRVTEQLGFGTQLVWVVDPEARTVTICLPGKEPNVLHEKDALFFEEILPDFRCKVADFFALPGE